MKNFTLLYISIIIMENIWNCCSVSLPNTAIQKMNRHCPKILL